MRLKFQSRITITPGQSQDLFRQGIIFSFLGHALLALGLIWVRNSVPSGGPMIMAAGPGDAGYGGATEVGVVGASEWLKFYPQFDVATLGEERSASPAIDTVINEAKVETGESADFIPREIAKPEKKIPDLTKTTDRPVARTTEKPYSPDEPRGATPSKSALIRIPGSPFPDKVRGGIGLGIDAGGPGGIPGGSEYGRRLQQALIGYYRLTPTNLQNPRFVIVRVQVDRNGRVLSIDNGRLRPESFVQKSGNIVIDNRVVAALLELNRNPIPFPPGLLPGVREAAVEIYFQY